MTRLRPTWWWIGRTLAQPCPRSEAFDTRRVSRRFLVESAEKYIKIQIQGWFNHQQSGIQWNINGIYWDLFVNGNFADQVIAWWFFVAIFDWQPVYIGWWMVIPSSWIVTIPSIYIYYIHINTHVFIYIYILHTCIYIYIHIYIHVYIYIYTCMYVNKYKYIYIYINQIVYIYE